MKTLISWTVVGIVVGIVVMVASPFIIDWLKQHLCKTAAANRGEIGFHTALVGKSST